MDKQVLLRTISHAYNNLSYLFTNVPYEEVTKTRKNSKYPNSLFEKNKLTLNYSKFSQPLEKYVPKQTVPKINVIHSILYNVFTDTMCTYTLLAKPI